MPQSRVSNQLQRIKTVFPLVERKEGRKSYLSLPEDAVDGPVLSLFADEIRESRQGQLDQEALKRLIENRRVQAKGQATLGKNDLPGRTWEGFARALLTMIPKQRVLDVGIGEGEMTLLLCQFATEVHAVDPDKARLTRFSAKAEAQGLKNITCHDATVEKLPLPSRSVDLVMASQLLHLLDDPAAAVRECVRVLDDGGRLLVLDLLSHNEGWVKERFGHKKLGFTHESLRDHLEAAGLTEVEVQRVAKDKKPPRFVSILATGRKEVT